MLLADIRVAQAQTDLPILDELERHREFVAMVEAVDRETVAD